MAAVLIIVNPVAGKKQARTAIFDVINAFDVAGYDVIVKYSHERGHAREIAKEARADRYSRVVCLGGDGTLNEVITGLTESGENIPLGYIPLGSTNDFAASLSIPHNPEAAAKLAVEGNEVKLDVGRFGEDRKFSYVASFGAFTATSYNTPQSVKNALGHLAYLLASIKDITTIKPIHMRIHTGEKTIEDDFLFGAVANTTSIGGVVKLDSSIVSMDDGIFEMLLIKRIANPQELASVIGGLLTSNLNCKNFIFEHIEGATFETDELLSWSLDGEEASGGTSVTISTMPGAITLIK